MKKNLFKHELTKKNKLKSKDEYFKKKNNQLKKSFSNFNSKEKKK